MAWFVIAIILWVAALLAGVVGLVSDEGRKAGPYAGAVLAVIVGFALFALGGVKSVPVKNIGVPQSFGAVGSTVFEPGAMQSWEES